MGFLDKIQGSISSAAEQTKTKAQETQVKRDRKLKLEALGEQVYNLYMSGQLAQQELIPACQEVQEIDGRIAALEQQYQAARPQPAAPPVAGAVPPPSAPPPPAAPPPPPPPAAGPPPPPAPAPPGGTTEG